MVKKYGDPFGHSSTVGRFAQLRLCPRVSSGTSSKRYEERKASFDFPFAMNSRRSRPKVHPLWKKPRTYLSIGRGGW